MKHLTHSQVLNPSDLTQQKCISQGFQEGLSLADRQLLAMSVCGHCSRGRKCGPKCRGAQSWCPEVTRVRPSPSRSNERSAALPRVWVINTKDDTKFIPATQTTAFPFPSRSCLNANAESSILPFFANSNILSEHASLFCVPFQGTSVFPACHQRR